MLSDSTSQICPLPVIRGIYGLRNKANGKWYIGQSVNIHSRWARYKRLNCSTQRKLLRALQKYGYDGFDKIILEHDVSDQALLDARESFWITYYKAMTDGYNIRSGGGRGKFSEEAKKRMSEATRPPHTAEQKLKISLGNRGKVMSQESRAKMSAAKRGKLHSTGAKMKISASKLGKRRGPHSEAHKQKISESCKASQWGWERGRRKKEQYV